MQMYQNFNQFSFIGTIFNLQFPCTCAIYKTDENDFDKFVDFLDIVVYLEKLH